MTIWLFFFFFGFYEPSRFISATTTCLHLSLSWTSSSPPLTIKLDASFLIMSFYPCLGRPLGLLVSGFQLVANLIGSSDLHMTCSAHPSLLLLRTPIICVSPYSFFTFWFVLISNSPKEFLFGPNIFIRIFHSKVGNLF